MGKFLIFFHSGDFGSLIRQLSSNPDLVTVHLDTSRESLSASPAQFKIPVGPPGGVSEQILECLPQVAKEPYRFHQVFNELSAKVGKVDGVLSISGYPSAGMVIKSVFTPLIKCHPLYSHVPLLSIEVIDSSKLDTDFRSFWTFSGITHIHDWSNVTVVFDNAWRGWSEAGAPFSIENQQLARLIEDFTANNPVTKAVNFEKKIWEGFRLNEEFGELRKRKNEAISQVSGKLLDFNRDLLSLIPNRYSDKWSVLANFHPSKPVNNAHELVEEALANLTVELKYPTYGEVGAMVLVHKVPYFNDLEGIIRDRISEKALCRQFTFSPELHHARGVVAGFLGIPWQNLPILVKLYERAKHYAERYAEEIVPELFEKSVKELSMEKTRERMAKKGEDFRKAVERAIFVKYSQKRKTVEKSLLEDLDEDLRKKVKEILEKRTSNNILTTWERETKTPNPISAIVQEAFSST